MVGRDEAFAVLLPDDLVDAETPATKQLIDVHSDTGTGVFALVEVPTGHEHMYGIVSGDEIEKGRIRCDHMVEKPAPGTAPSRLGIVGRYVLPGQIFSHLEATQPGRGGEIQLTDALLSLMKTEGFHGHLLQGDRYDTGDVGGLIEANLAFAMKDPALRERLVRFMERYR